MIALTSLLLFAIVPVSPYWVVRFKHRDSLFLMMAGLRFHAALFAGGRVTTNTAARRDARVCPKRHLKCFWSFLMRGAGRFI